MPGGGPGSARARIDREEARARPRRRRLLLVGIAIVLVVGAFLAWQAWRAFDMPGESWSGALPPLTSDQAALRDALRADVERIAGAIGERNVRRPKALDQCRAFLAESLEAAGWVVRSQPYEAGGVTVHNVIGERAGGEARDEILVVGAHYDTVPGSPGANDNGSGVASVLALARALGASATRRTLRMAFFVNEEPPFFQSSSMGSLVYARSCKAAGERVVGMLSLETLGYYTDAEDTQRTPFSLVGRIPSKGNFVSVVGNGGSRDFVRRVVGLFREMAQFPSEGAALPGTVSAAGWSDQWSFWQVGFPGLMVTDTAPFRYPWYHTPQDTPDRLDYERLARVVDGLRRVVSDLAGA